MLTAGVVEAVPRAGRERVLGGWAAPGLSVAGTVASGAFVGDACGTSLALPASGLALTVASALLWLTGVRGERRDRISLSIAVAIALLSIAALQQLLVCALGRAGMAAAELLQAGGLLLLFVALALELVRRRRAARALRERAARQQVFSGMQRYADEPLAQTVEAIAKRLGRQHGIEVVCDLSPDVAADDATRRALLRLLRRAIADAARVGATRSVRVELRAGPRLSVTQDGRGFDPSAPASAAAAG